VLSDPGQPPVWHGPAASVTSGISIRGEFSDGHSDGMLLTSSQRFDVGGPWVGFGYGIGFHADSDRSEVLLISRGELAVPVVGGRQGAIAPFVGFEAVPHFDVEGNDDANLRLGPAIGVSFALNPVLSQHGPFPVSYERALLGNTHIDVGMTWWFGDDAPDSGEPGLTIAIDYAFGR